ncbi:MAG TPA: gliding motility-associated ABC transporter ATP-binding subunit GldA [Cytophagales bacterium]|nr:gliding motility-associated ABC transporter ATP-binding subunit GldA [Cytophagales bacterium]HAP58401.1 gliding motility-associated ABC transporter ATP-binding subunit GldA [Cytophagales bacterium]
MSLTVENLTKIYGRQRAVDSISFSVKPGEILGFLGPNGAGKSTTMKIAACYLPPTEGTVEVQGYNVVDKPMAVRKNIGYLPEHNPLYLDLYVHEYLRFIGRLHGLRGKKLRSRVNEMVDLTGLVREQHKKIGALSKGYRQRVGLAQALIHNPSVLILDEPTTGLDPNQIVEIRRLIKDISQEKTVILSTHIMQEVQALCDRVVIINQGLLVADDTVDSLTAKAGGTPVLKVTLSGEIDERKLMQLPGVNRVEALEGQDYRLHTEQESETRKAVVALAAAEGWDVESLSKEQASLESVFQQLTQS